MRVVAHITPWFWDQTSVFGGAERYVLNISNAQHDLFSSYRIHIRSIGRVSKPLQRTIDPSVVLYPEADPRISASRIISELIATDQPDVWHVHQHRSPFGMAVILILRSLGQRIVATDLGWVEPWDTRIYRVSDLADLVVAISDYAAKRDTTITRKVVIKGGVQANKTAIDPLEEGLLYVGRILPHKGPLEMVKCLPTGAPLKVAGAVTDRAYAKAVSEVCRKKGFEFIPNPSDEEVAFLRTRTSVGLMPTLKGPGFEYMGLSALESLACSRPVVAMNSGGLREFVEHDRNGVLVESHEELAREAMHLLRDSQRLDLLRAGSTQSAEEFCCHSVSQKLDRAYSSLV
jgi:glycosyltransferase involved in cell wall biosynthesis